MTCSSFQKNSFKKLRGQEPQSHEHLVICVISTRNVWSFNNDYLEKNIQLHKYLPKNWVTINSAIQFMGRVRKSNFKSCQWTLTKGNITNTQIIKVYFQQPMWTFRILVDHNNKLHSECAQGVVVMYHASQEK